MDIFIFFSKYIFLIYIILFVATSTIYILNEKNIILKTEKSPQVGIILFFHIMCFFILSFTKVITSTGLITYTYSIEPTIFAFVVILLLFTYKVIVYFFYHNSDVIIINSMLFLMDISLVFLYRLDKNLAYRQLLWFFVGGICLLILPLMFKLFIKCREKIKYFSWVLVIILLPLLFLPSFFGTVTNGSTNWISIKALANISFQPSEIVKLFFILFLSLTFSKCKSIPSLIYPTIISFICVCTLVIQNDLGGALIFYITYLTLLYITTSSQLLFLLGLFSASGAAYFCYKFIPHIQVRVEAWSNPFASPYDKGLQILQSLFAIGTWGPFGSGLTHGYPKYVPVVDSDFIFSGISEEFGGIFSIFIIILFLLIFARGISIASKCSKKYLTLIVMGISVIILFQAFLIIGGDIKFIPLTGVTLPFVSYGGTSSFISIIMIGILLRIDIINIEEYGEEEIIPNFKRKTIKNVSILYTLLLTVMIIFLSKFVFFDSTNMVISSYNPRLSMSINNSNILRGSIVDSNSVPLAYSEMQKNGTIKRIYPFKNVYAHVVGFNSHGKQGLESSYNFQLLTPHNEIIQRTLSLFTGKNINGNTVKLSIENKLQTYVYNQLGTKKGAIIVSQPSTGRILAMVSSNSFDPNTIDENWDTISNKTVDSPLLNRATDGLYPPGSVFKIISSLAIINTLPLYKTYNINCTGEVTIDGETLTDNNKEAHGKVNLYSAFTDSCNSYFATAINKIGNKPLIDYANQMYFNKDYPFDLKHSNSVFALKPDDNVGLQIRTAIGQGDTLVTPLHLSMITNSVANGGVMMKPMLVDEIKGYNNKVITKVFPTMIEKVMTPENSDTLTSMMENVVLNGTGKGAKLSKITMAGKTGTAQVNGAASHGLFVGFAPADNPQVSITIVLENSGGSGSTLGIAKNIMNFYFDNNSKN